MPKVSVILTSYNHEKYLRESIESVLNQTYTDFELIIVDDASSDNSWEIIQSYKDDRIIAIRNRQNVIYVLNEPISNIAKGKYIAVHHSDDIWEPEKLQKQVDFLDKNSAYGAAFTWVQIIDEYGKNFCSNFHFYSKIFNQPNRTRFEWLNFFFYKGNALCHPSVLIRAECYKNIGLYDYRFVQLADFLMWIKLCFAYEIYVIPERLTKFRVRIGESNSSGDRPDTRLRNIIELFALLNSYIAITSQEDFLAIFPERNDLVSPNGFIPEYALAMISIDTEIDKPHSLFGLQLLFNAMTSENKRRQLEEVYGFTYKDFIKLKSQYDIFGVNGNIMNCNVSLYIDTGKGFNEEEKIEQRTNISNGNIIVKFDLNKYKNIVNIRFDPIEGYACACKILGLETNVANIVFSAINAEYCHENEYVFIDTDPIIEIKGELANISYLTIRYTIRLLQSSEISESYKEIKAKYEYEKSQLNEIYNYYGWKLIKKFNTIIDRFLRYKR